MSKSPWRRNDLIYLNRHSGNGYGNGEGGGGGGTGGSGIAVIGKYPTNIYGLYNLTSYGGIYFDTTAAYQNMRMWIAGSGQLPVYDVGQTGLAYHKFIRYIHNRNISMASNAAETETPVFSFRSERTASEASNDFKRDSVAKRKESVSASSLVKKESFPSS